MTKSKKRDWPLWGAGLGGGHFTLWLLGMTAILNKFIESSVLNTGPKQYRAHHQSQPHGTTQSQGSPWWWRESPSRWTIPPWFSLSFWSCTSPRRWRSPHPFVALTILPTTTVISFTVIRGWWSFCWRCCCSAWLQGSLCFCSSERGCISFPGHRKS